MKVLVQCLWAVAVVMLASSCATITGGNRLGAQTGTRVADAAFQAQKVDVDFVAAWSRFQRADRSGAERYLARASNTLSQQGGDVVALDRLRAGLRSGNSVSEQDFERTLAGSHQAMAQFYQQRASRFLASREDRAAGASMEAMAYHTEGSARWSGQTLDPNQQQEISRLRTVGNALQTGSGYLVKGSGYLVQGTGWVLGKGFELLSYGGERTRGTAGSVIRGTGQGGETGSRWVQGAGNGIRRFGDWILGTGQTN